MAILQLYMNIEIQTAEVLCLTFVKEAVNVHFNSNFNLPK